MKKNVPIVLQAFATNVEHEIVRGIFEIEINYYPATTRWQSGSVPTGSCFAKLKIEAFRERPYRRIECATTLIKDDERLPGNVLFGSGPDPKSAIKDLLVAVRQFDTLEIKAGNGKKKFCFPIPKDLMP